MRLRSIGVAVLVATVGAGVWSATAGVAESVPCPGVLCRSPTPAPASSPSATPSATIVSVATPSSSNAPLPPTATPAQAVTPVPTLGAPLPAGVAPEVPAATPSGVSLLSGAAVMASQPRGDNPLAGFLVLALIVLVALGAASTWLFFKLR